MEDVFGRAQHGEDADCGGRLKATRARSAVLLFLVLTSALVVGDAVAGTRADTDPGGDRAGLVADPVDTDWVDLVSLDWRVLFRGDGTLRDDLSADGTPGSNGIPDALEVYNCIGARFIDENMSAGVATDMSVLAGSEWMVDNGLVAPEHDLGNGYLHSMRDRDGNLVVRLGVDRYEGLATATTSHIALELNQDLIRVRSGTPWPVYGERQEGDLLVRVTVEAGVPGAVELMRWQKDKTGRGSFVPLSGLGADCGGEPTAHVACRQTSPPGLAPTNTDVWDLSSAPVWVPAHDAFLELAVNAGRLSGDKPFQSAMPRTPQDVTFGYVTGHTRTTSHPRPTGNHTGKPVSHRDGELDREQSHRNVPTTMMLPKASKPTAGVAQ